MKPANFISLTIAYFLFVFMSGIALADEQSMDETRVIAVVPVKNGNVDQKVYRQFDRIVPELVKIPKTKIVKLEYRFAGQADRDMDVENAYNTAARIEKYLRVRHKLDLDLWLAVDITPKSSKTPSALTIAVYSDDIKKLDAVQVEPQKKE
jgi:hypothetical protein